MKYLQNLDLDYYLTFELSSFRMYNKYMIDLHPRILKMYAEGKSIGFIARTLKTYNNRVVKILKEGGVHVRNQHEGKLIGWENRTKYHMNETFFDTWSNDLAWFIGLMYADGHIWKDSSRAALTAKDTTFLSQVRDLLGSNYRIELKATTPQLIINGSKRVEHLMKFGLTPSKSHTMKFPNVPEAYLSHFVRGYFDGDGYVSVRKEGWLSIGADIGSQAFADGLSEVLSNVVGSTIYQNTRIRYRQYDGRTWNTSHPIFCIRVHGSKAAAVLQWMYISSTSKNRWDYKYKKALSFL